MGWFNLAAVVLRFKESPENAPLPHLSRENCDNRPDEPFKPCTYDMARHCASKLTLVSTISLIT